MSKRKAKFVPAPLPTIEECRAAYAKQLKEHAAEEAKWRQNPTAEQLAAFREKVSAYAAKTYEMRIDTTPPSLEAQREDAADRAYYRKQVGY